MPTTTLASVYRFAVDVPMSTAVPSAFVPLRHTSEYEKFLKSTRDQSRMTFLNAPCAVNAVAAGGMSNAGRLST